MSRKPSHYRFSSSTHVSVLSFDLFKFHVECSTWHYPLHIHRARDRHKQENILCSVEAEFFFFLVHSSICNFFCLLFYFYYTFVVFVFFVVVFLGGGGIFISFGFGGGNNGIAPLVYAHEKNKTHLLWSKKLDINFQSK